jgi:sensor histidine kinase YesM
MNNIIWSIILSAAGLSTIAAWIVVGIQFNQISGESIFVKRKLLFCCSMIAVVLIAIVNHLLQVTRSPLIIEGTTMFLCYFYLFVVGRIFYRRSLFLIFKVLILFVTMVGIVGLFQTIYGIVSEQLSNLLPIHLFLFVSQIFTTVIILLSGGILKKIFLASNWKGRRFPGKMIPQCLYLIVFGFVLVSTQEYMLYFLKGGIILFILGWVSILLTGIFALDLYGIREQRDQVNKELLMYKQETELRYAHYQELEEKYKESRKLVHDIRNHLNSIASLYEKGEQDAAFEYTQTIHKMLNRLTKKYYCTNRMLNIILSDKMEHAQREGIEVKIKVGEVSNDWIKDIDITTIFANLLDNAVTAAKAAKAMGEEAWIHLFVRCVRDFVVIEIKNSCLLRGRTELKVKKESGLGLKNVKFTVDKYNGTFETVEEENSFRVIIIIPVEV